MLSGLYLAWELSTLEKQVYCRTDYCAKDLWWNKYNKLIRRKKRTKNIRIAEREKGLQNMEDTQRSFVSENL